MSTIYTARRTLGGFTISVDSSRSPVAVASFGNDDAGRDAFEIFKMGCARCKDVTLIDGTTGDALAGTVGELDAASRS